MDASTPPPTYPLFRPGDESASDCITFEFEGRRITAPAGISIAAALLLNGAGSFRATPVKAAPRAPYCMMGVCFDCLVEVDGTPNRQACLTPACDGMVIQRQLGAPDLGSTFEGAGHDA